MSDKIKLPYFDFYYQDFLTGTAHYTHQQIGIYITLMCHAGVRNGDGLPNDFEQLCRIVNLYSNDPDLVESLKTDLNLVINEKFKLLDNKWHNVRQLEDYKKKVDIINLRIESGKKGGLAKAKQNSSKESVSVSVSDSVYTDIFNSIWDQLLIRRGSKKRAFKVFQQIGGQIDSKLIIDKYNELCRSTDNHIFIPHLSTWLSQERYYDEEVFNLDNFKKINKITANYIDTKNNILLFQSKESFGLMEWFYHKDGTTAKKEEYYG